MSKNNPIDEVLDFLNDTDLALESTKVLDKAQEDNSTPANEELSDTVCFSTPEDDAYVLLSALEEESTPEEYLEILANSAVEMQLYGLIPNAEIALEAQRNIVKLNRQATFSKVEKRAAIRLAAQANDPNYKFYRKGRDMMIAARDKIMVKYAARAKQEAKKSIANARKKAANMKSSGGKSIEKKIDRTLSKLDSNGRTNDVIKPADK